MILCSSYFTFLSYILTCPFLWFWAFAYSAPSLINGANKHCKSPHPLPPPPHSWFLDINTSFCCEVVTYLWRHTDGQQVHEKMLNIANHQGKANQNHKEISPHTCQNGYYQKVKITSVREDVEEWETLCTVGGNAKTGAATMVALCLLYPNQIGRSSKTGSHVSFNPISSH